MLGLVWLAGRLARLRPTPSAPGLTLRATLAIGPRRRLHLIDAEGTRLLILAGPASESALLLPPKPE